MLKWLRNRLKWWIAADEMAEVERWRIRCGEYDRWLASYPDIVLVLQNLRGVAQGRIESWHGAPAEWGPVGIHALRQQVERLRAAGVKTVEVPSNDPAPPNSLPDWYECQRILDNANFRKRAAAGLEGSVLDTPPTTPEPTELHRFIYEYDDADPYRSAWFLHRLEMVLQEARAALASQAQPVGAKEALEAVGYLMEAAGVDKSESADTLRRFIASQVVQEPVAYRWFDPEYDRWVYSSDIGDEEPKPHPSAQVKSQPLYAAPIATGEPHTEVVPASSVQRLMGDLQKRSDECEGVLIHIHRDELRKLLAAASGVPASCPNCAGWKLVAESALAAAESGERIEAIRAKYGLGTRGVQPSDGGQE